MPVACGAQVGKTVLHTVAGFLLVSLASPAYDLARLRGTSGAEGVSSPSAGMQWASRRQAEAFGLTKAHPSHITCKAIEAIDHINAKDRIMVPVEPIDHIKA